MIKIGNLYAVDAGVLLNPYFHIYPARPQNIFSVKIVDKNSSFLILENIEPKITEYVRVLFTSRKTGCIKGLVRCYTLGKISSTFKKDFSMSLQSFYQKNS